MRKIFKIISINSIIFFFIIICVDLIFGYWLDDLNFGPNMRGKRIQKIVFEKKNEKIFYYRDFYGFRENKNIYEKYDTSKIKVVFNGGSTGDEMFLNYDDTIVGVLNANMKNENIKLKIYNASLSGKSLTGNLNEFSDWFENIPNFKPEIMIYYLGINDRILLKNRWHDNEKKNNFIDFIVNNISQKSFFWEKVKKIKDKYFYSNRNIDRYFTSDKKLSLKLKKNNFISYDVAKKTYMNLNDKEYFIIETYKKKLIRLKKILNTNKIKPIFITQITHDINGQKILFYLNDELKKFALRNNYEIIKLDELVMEPMPDSFIDEIHTNKSGSLKIANIIYPILKNKLLSHYDLPH